MRSASVGFQCPECVAEGAKSVRQPRTVLGGRVSADVGRVTGVLIGLNVLVFLVGFGVPNLSERFGNLALAVTQQGQLVGVGNGQYYRLVTAAFLHAGLFHILFNMFALVQIGPLLEQALGRWRFLALYLLSALGGSVTGYLFAPLNQPSVGASGAIFGLFGAYYVVVRKLGGDTQSILVLLGINLVITFTVRNIDYRAHLGGLVTGALIAAAFAYLPRGSQQARLHAAVVAGVALLLAVAVVVRTGALTG
ncbi:MAG: rhomboid family intramembrane serine protease [Actinobacteria bacterium]|nr:rhomboid family intramembrane serine protease [Actinomycetota bacterium]MCA1721995.1 rhomboid family intramembrane serine protease [Actinomycetota bacterium]